MKKNLNRRQFLGGIGKATAASTLLNTSMMTSGMLWSRSAFAADADTKVVFVYIPDGAIPDRWHPTGTGSNFTLPQISNPLESVKEHCTFINGLSMSNPGHNGYYQPLGNTNTTIDYYLSQTMGATTPFSALHLGVVTEGHKLSRANGSGVDYEDSPFNAFNRLFGSGAATDIDTARSLSVLDVQLSSLNSMMSKLGSAERARLEMHADSIRTLEQRIQSAASNNQDASGCSAPVFNTGGFNGAVDDSSNFDEICDLQIDLIVLALKCGLTRLGCFMMHNHQSNAFIPQADVSGSYHTSIHGMGADQYAKYSTYFTTKLARLISKLAAASDTDGNSLLDNTIVARVTDMADGRYHNGTNPPFMLAGGNKLIKAGQSLSVNVEAKSVLDTVAYAAGMDVGGSFKQYGSGPISSLLA